MVNAQPHRERDAYRRRLVRPWRIAFVVYAVALTTGTHWPQLTFGPEVPATDKSLHFVAFAGLTVLLARTRWLWRRTTIVLAALTWAALDEWTQGLPGLGRHSGIEDVVASGLGVIVAGAWMWAFAPVGGQVNRRRVAHVACAFDRLFAQAGTWWTFAVIGVAGALPIVVVALIGSQIMTRRVFMLSIVVTAVIAGFVLSRLWVEALRAVYRDRPCASCGAPLREQLMDARGGYECAACGESCLAAEWVELIPPPVHERRRLAAGPVFVAGVMLVAIFFGLAAFTRIYAALIGTDFATEVLAPIVHGLRALPSSLERVIDLALLLLIIAVAARLYRARLGRCFDDPERCRACGHDLRGTPTPLGAGRCGECGVAFRRMDDAKAPDAPPPTEAVES